jgi:hypothetical protein
MNDEEMRFHILHCLFFMCVCIQSPTPFPFPLSPSSVVWSLSMLFSRQQSVPILTHTDTSTHPHTTHNTQTAIIPGMELFNHQSNTINRQHKQVSIKHVHHSILICITAMLHSVYVSFISVLFCLSIRYMLNIGISLTPIMVNEMLHLTYEHKQCYQKVGRQFNIQSFDITHMSLHILI